MAKRKTLPQYAMPNDTPIPSPLRAGLATIPGSLMDALQTYERMALATRPEGTSEGDLTRAQETPEERVQQIRMDAYVQPGESAAMDAKIAQMRSDWDAKEEAFGKAADSPLGHHGTALYPQYRNQALQSNQGYVTAAGNTDAWRKPEDRLYPYLGSDGSVQYMEPLPGYTVSPTMDYQQRQAMDPGRFPGPMVGTYGTGHLPTREEVEAAEWARKSAEVNASAAPLQERLRERAIERGMYGQNADMTRYHPVTNPLGRIVTTGQHRDDGTEMLKDRVSGLPYYQGPDANTGASRENVGRSMMGEAGVRAGLVTDLGEGASPRYVPKGYSPPVDAKAAAQQRFNEYMSGAADRRRRKFESGSVTGDLADEVRDEASKRIDTFAGKQLDEAGQQLYGKLSRDLQEINKSRIRPAQKSRALRRWMDEFDSAGLGRHVVHTPTTQDMLNNSVVDAQGNRWSIETRDGKPKLVKVSDAPDANAGRQAMQKLKSAMVPKLLGLVNPATGDPMYKNAEEATAAADQILGAGGSQTPGEARMPPVYQGQDGKVYIEDDDGNLRWYVSDGRGGMMDSEYSYAGDRNKLKLLNPEDAGPNQNKTDQPDISGVLDEFERVLRSGTAAAPGASLEAARNFAKLISAEIAKNPALKNDPRVKRALGVAAKILEATGA